MNIDLILNNQWRLVQKDCYHLVQKILLASCLGGA